MDMNRYLIVVFCVLTGCAAAVPMANAQDFSVDNELFAEWYADHVQHFDEAFSSPILVHVEQEQLAGSCFSNTEELSVLKNLPKIPALSQISNLLNEPEPRDFIGFLPYSEPIFNQTVKCDNPIRAPGAVC
ncbi:hypothetical protein [Marinifilum caeruleilacunae]|uniref:Uncharacterized protein n=1 Tax=Marinifilum caeruleilacunae TaxID=2499076 RepID=A0ABX1WQG3_9BACT|nr:hypothetical protein [Marinifilum caeruleilacunae]NOU58329.1 hypothetical protein [Marinifilum caeruleilacunae]